MITHNLSKVFHRHFDSLHTNNRSLFGLVKFLHSLLLPLTGTDDESFIKLLLLFQLYLLLDLIIILR